VGNKDSVRFGLSRHRTVCEVWREVMDIAIEEGGDLGAKLELLIDEGFSMSKRMNAKLQEYSKIKNPMGWDKNQNRKASSKLREAR